MKFRRQHPIGKYIADFYCFEQNLVVEIDGGYHDTNSQRPKDLERTEDLVEMGVRVIRFENQQVLDDVECVVREIARELASPRPLS